ncbi:MAG: hypothetical protein KGR16_06960 [Verrucomicrobia bacterium]|nr:hypothetical protein [Verrucomicrobiota bacterium]MDE3046778.1 hypothetical protein [Verrucomicrobiota bacterium]
MSMTEKQTTESTIHEEIRSNAAWYGHISGLIAEKMLRGRKTPYLYILRKGEHETTNKADYYVTFILPDLSIKHQPFTITLRPNGWEWENTNGGICSLEDSLEQALYLMMHCNKDQPIALNRLTIR